ncbi:acyl-CoA N-acyltransferase [Gautieria morchelliformis]|nr:acyl-CoA N-acyltransferase [Gautieria morchelliformis]
MSKWPEVQLNSPWGRLILIPPGPEDDVQVAALRSDPDALRYLSFMPKTTSVEECREKREALSATDNAWPFHIHINLPSPSASAFAGQCAILRMDITHRSTEIGIMINSALHRTGIATEALYMILSHAFEYPDLKLHRVQFLTSSSNVPMRGWLESFGIQLEYRQREAWINGEDGWQDVVGYSILETEWSPLKARMQEKLTARLGLLRE